MSVDLTKLVLHTGYDTFKNDTGYAGTYSVTGSTASGLNTRTVTVALDAAPNMTDVLFTGRNDSSGTDPRPSGAWFKKGAIYVLGNNSGAGYVNEQTTWNVYASINGSTLTITLVYVQQFSASLTLTSTDLSYKLVDYSVTG